MDTTRNFRDDSNKEGYNKDFEQNISLPVLSCSYNGTKMNCNCNWNNKGNGEELSHSSTTVGFPFWRHVLRIHNPVQMTERELYNHLVVFRVKEEQMSFFGFPYMENNRAYFQVPLYKWNNYLSNLAAQNHSVGSGKKSVTCCRCRMQFCPTESTDSCHKHPGKLEQDSKGQSSDGETVFPHVWTGSTPGHNQLPDYVETRTPPLSRARNTSSYLIVAIDCESSFTRDGLELTRITMLDYRGRIILNTYVMPHNPIIDYNTPFSGITKNILESASTMTLTQVQNCILNMTTNQTLIIGHGLENDLRILRMIHGIVLDTALLYDCDYLSNPPRRSSLKNVAKTYLNRNIQQCSSGHNSVEDAIATLDLAKHYLNHSHVNVCGITSYLLKSYV